jgi:hypothetical protein
LHGKAVRRSDTRRSKCPFDLDIASGIAVGINSGHARRTVRYVGGGRRYIDLEPFEGRFGAFRPAGHDDPLAKPGQAAPPAASPPAELQSCVTSKEEGAVKVGTS